MIGIARRFMLGAAVLGLTGIATEAKAGLVLTYENAGVQATTVAGVKTETFNSIAPGQYTSLTTAVGTLTATSPGLDIVPADQFGGAGGTFNYLAVGAESAPTTSATLALNGLQTYFGFWWSAADSGNSVEFLRGNNVVATYTTASALGSLSSAYNGNPNDGYQDSGEKFAYVNFTATGDTKFDKVIFMNSGTGTGFEADNFSVLAPVPEPSSLVLCGLGGAIGLGVHRRRRRRSNLA